MGASAFNRLKALTRSPGQDFWFTLMHELAHLVLGHEGSFIDEIGDAECLLNAREKKTDRLAADWLVPPRAYTAFLRERRARFPLEAVVAFAESIGRRPGIVAGRLHHDGKLNCKYLRATLARVSPFLREWVDRPAPLSLVKEIDRASARSTMKMTS